MRHKDAIKNGKMQQIRILQVLNRIEYGSGACAVLMNYYNHMDKQKIIFDFLVHGETKQELRKQLESSGSRIYRMPPLGVRYMVMYQKALKQFFHMHPEYTVIQGNIPNAAVFYLGAAKRARIPVRILHAHSAGERSRSLKSIRNFLLDRAGVFYANTYFSCSRKAALHVYGNKARNVRIVKNAVDTARYRFDKKKRREYRKKLGLEQEWVLGHVGRFSKEKNHMFLLEILQAVKKKGISCRLLLVGDGEERERIVRKAVKLGIQDSIIFTGMTNEAEGYLNAMDLFLLPSFFEGLPLAGIEAQCSGLPCLFSDTVTREAKILDTTRFLPIHCADLWAETAVRMRGIRKENAWMYVEKYGYSIEKEAAKLMKEYSLRALNVKRVNL